MLDFKNVEYKISCPSLAFRPKEALPEVVFLGKSNVGKSTFINSLVGRKVAYSSKKAGKTKLLNYFIVDASFFLVDSPGYGYTAYGTREDASFRDMMEGYFVDNPYLKGAVALVDGRRGLSEDDLLLISFLKRTHTPYILVYTKTDLAPQSQIAKLKKEMPSYLPKAVYLSPRFAPVPELRKAIIGLLEER